MQFATCDTQLALGTDAALPVLRKIIIALLSFDRTCRRRYVTSASSRERTSDFIGAFDASIATKYHIPIPEIPSTLMLEKDDNCTFIYYTNRLLSFLSIYRKFFPHFQKII